MNKAFTRHQDQMVLQGGQNAPSSAQAQNLNQTHAQHLHQRKPTVSAHAQGNQNILRNRERFESFKGRLGAKSNPPSADTATTATSTNATILRQQQATSSGSHQNPSAPAQQQNGGSAGGPQVLQGGMSSMRTLFQNTAERYTSRLPPPGVPGGPCSMLNDSLRMVTAGASLYSSQQTGLKPQNIGGIANHTTDYSNGEFRRSVFAKDSAPKNVPDNMNDQNRSSQIINPCDS